MCGGFESCAGSAELLGSDVQFVVRPCFQIMSSLSKILTMPSLSCFAPLMPAPTPIPPQAPVDEDPPKFLKGLCVVDDVAYFGINVWGPRSKRDSSSNNGK